MKLKKLTLLGLSMSFAALSIIPAMAATTYYYDEEDGVYYYYDDDDDDYYYDDTYYYDNYDYWNTYSTTYYNYTIGDAYWDTSNNKAVAYWDKAVDKTGYKVQLYRQTSSSYKKVGGVKSTSSDHYDFSSAIVNEGSGTYYFTVYPTKGGTGYMEGSGSIDVGSNGDITISELKKSTSTTTTTNTVSGGPGTTIGWHRAADGKRWWYQETSTTYSANKWMYINNQWYHFDKDGYMQTGWFYNSATDKQWYYLDPVNGNMVTNTVIDGYVINANGVWVH